MEVTEVEMVMDVRDLQSAKALLLIVSTEVGEGGAR
eukprot:CAMPEP_0201106896 /NCGR_PEP_ID=MMETSP0812-20130820/53863_1 /ASSEMBLY_ACC=CAM_ASM_000668 /TAXON_ID=98059 /ORGANISM="Dinobryon sp., Strain UTEXLB2267" /LENGTH=35 /DNA_ID= /DNA_START= /DNA_END= /DNA_ORIENTATION=